jgi:hypothetical protein
VTGEERRNRITAVISGVGQWAPFADQLEEQAVFLGQGAPKCWRERTSFWCKVRNKVVNQPSGRYDVDTAATMLIRVMRKVLET